jgi:hypothetical protein
VVHGAAQSDKRQPSETDAQVERCLARGEYDDPRRSGRSHERGQLLEPSAKIQVVQQCNRRHQIELVSRFVVEESAFEQVDTGKVDNPVSRSTDGVGVWVDADHSVVDRGEALHQ